MDNLLDNVEVEPVIEEARGAEDVVNPADGQHNQEQQHANGGSSPDSEDERYEARMRQYRNERLARPPIDDFDHGMDREDALLAHRFGGPGGDGLDDDAVGVIEGARLIRDDIDQPVADEEPRAESPDDDSDEDIPPEQLFDPEAARRIFEEMNADEELERERANRARMLAEEAARIAEEQHAAEMDRPIRGIGPRTPPLEPGMIPIAGEPGYVPPEEEENDNDEEYLGRPRVGPRTPPEEDYREPSPDMYDFERERAFARQVSEGEQSAAELALQQHRQQEAAAAAAVIVEEKRTGPHTPNSPPPPSSQASSPATLRDASLSPLHRRKRPNEGDSSDDDDDDVAERELTHPTVVTQKCLSLLEFVEKKGLTINDDEMLQVVRDALLLDNAMEAIVEKKEMMKKEMDEMTQWEVDAIREIHSNMPRHMQDVITIEGSTVHISQERTAMPPFSTSSSLMSLKYGQSLNQQMGLQPSAADSPSFALPQSVTLPTSTLAAGVASQFGTQPSASLLGPAPFGVQPLPQSSSTSSIQLPARSSQQRSMGITVQPIEPPGPLQGLNPIAFANAPPGLQLAPMPEYTRPPPAKKSAAQPNSQMNRVSNNLSSMLTNALKAQVSKNQGSFNGQPSTSKKSAVPSLMSINIPGVPKPSGA